MRGMIRLCLCSLFVAGGIGCASTRQMVKLPDQGKRVEDTEQARIYVIRPAFVGAAVSMTVKDGDETIGYTGPKGYLCWERAPGKATLCSVAENTGKLDLDVEKNCVYYVHQHVLLGFLMARTRLDSIDEAKGQEFLQKCKAPEVVPK